MLILEQIIESRKHELTVSCRPPGGGLFQSGSSSLFATMSGFGDTIRAAYPQTTVA